MLQGSVFLVLAGSIPGDLHEGLPESVVVRRRIVATLMGGAIALVALGLSRLPRLFRRVTPPAR